MIAAVSLAAAVVTGGSLTAVFTINGSKDTSARQSHTEVVSVPITKGALQSTTSVSGMLSYAGSRSISAGSGGVVTSLPAAGTEVKLGDSLFAVDNQPTYLMYGSLPAWRAFESAMSNGPDVKALEQSLKALGHFTSEPDETYTWATKAAIQRWQKATGQKQTGSIPFGGVVFAVGPVRVSDLTAKVGDQVAPGGEMLTVTDLTKVVRADLKLANQSLAKVGAKVVINLPEGKGTTGTVASVGVPTENEKKNQQESAEAIIPVTIELDDPASAGELERATVTVNFPTDLRENVLSVPLEALLALDTTRFGVEIVSADGTTKRVPVTTGMFAGGRVEVSGNGITEKQKVVVPRA